MRGAVLCFRRAPDKSTVSDHEDPASEHEAVGGPSTPRCLLPPQNLILPPHNQKRDSSVIYSLTLLGHDLKPVTRQPRHAQFVEGLGGRFLERHASKSRRDSGQGAHYEVVEFYYGLYGLEGHLHLHHFLVQYLEVVLTEALLVLVRRKGLSCLGPFSPLMRHTRFCQISGLEPSLGMMEGEKSTRSESEGGRREAKIRVLAAPEPRDLTDPVLAPHSPRRTRSLSA